MNHPLSRFAPSPSLVSLRDTGGRCPQRTEWERHLRIGAALAQGRSPLPRQFQRLWVAVRVMEN